MINNDRIVPIQKIDYLSMIGTIMTLNNTTFSILASSDVEGDFTVTGSGAAGNFLANQPIKTIEFPTAVTSATIYFVAAYDYVGMTRNGAALTPTGDIEPDGITLYKAVLASNAVTVTAVTPVLANE
jgi:energy-converting hydrogenase Eha subunit C